MVEYGGRGSGGRSNLRSNHGRNHKNMAWSTFEANRWPPSNGSNLTISVRVARHDGIQPPDASILANWAESLHIILGFPGKRVIEPPLNP